MKRKILIVVGVIYVAFIVEFIFYFSSDSDSETPKSINQISSISKSKTRPTSEDSRSSSRFTNKVNSTPLQVENTQIATNPKKKSSKSSVDQSKHSQGSENNLYLEQQVAEYADVEEIKKKIYNMNIEYIEDLENLEQIIQTGETDQTNFWEGDWYSVDDWKRRHDAFQLEIDENGSFSFATEDRIHQPSQAFTFDNEKREFYWEEDYYGKIISHRAKFITPSTLLIIKTSGVKVNLDIYEKAEN